MLNPMLSPDFLRVLQMALDTREDRIRAERALEVLRMKEHQATDALKAATARLRPQASAQ